METAGTIQILDPNLLVYRVWCEEMSFSKFTPKIFAWMTGWHLLEKIKVKYIETFLKKILLVQF